MRYYLLFTLLFLCGTCLSAQNLNQEEFKNVHDRIVIAFTKAIMPNYVGSKDCSQKDKDSYEQKIKEKLSNNNRNGYLPETVILVLGVGLLLFVILAFWLFRLQRQLNRLKKQVEKKTRSTQKENNIERLESKFQMQQEQIGRLKSDIQLVRQQIETKPKDRTMEQTPSNTVVLEVSPLPVSENKNKVIYAQIRNGNLEKVYEKERQYYKITCEQGRNEGTFELVDTPDLLIRAIKDKEAYIEPVCETCGIARTAKSIKTIIPGHVTTSDGEIWEVKNKAKIEYI